MNLHEGIASHDAGTTNRPANAVAARNDDPENMTPLTTPGAESLKARWTKHELTAETTQHLPLNQTTTPAELNASAVRSGRKDAPEFQVRHGSQKVR